MSDNRRVSKTKSVNGSAVVTWDYSTPGNKLGNRYISYAKDVSVSGVTVSTKLDKWGSGSQITSAQVTLYADGAGILYPTLAGSRTTNGNHSVSLTPDSNGNVSVTVSVVPKQPKPWIHGMPFFVKPATKMSVPIRATLYVIYTTGSASNGSDYTHQDPAHPDSSTETYTDSTAEQNTEVDTDIIVYPECTLAQIANGEIDDWTTNGAAILQPTKCVITEEAGGKYELEMTYPMEDAKWKYLKQGAVIKAPTPAHATPAGEIHSVKDVTNKVYSVADASKTYVKIRKKANDTSTVIERVNNGTEVERIAKNDADTWYKVQTPNGNTGWIEKSKCTYVREVDHTDYTIANIKQTRNQCFRIYEVEYDSAKNTCTVKARHVFYDFAGNMVGNLKLKEVKIEKAISKLKSALMFDHAGDIMTNMSDSTEITGDFSWKNPVSVLLDPEEGYVKKLHCQIVRDNEDIYILNNDTPTDRGYTIAYGKNLKGVKWSESNEDVITRIIPKGKKAKKEGDDSSADQVLLLDEKFVDSKHINEYAIIRTAVLDVEEGTVGEYTDDDGNKKTRTKSDALKNLKKAAEKEFKNGVDGVNVEVEVDFQVLEDTEEYRGYAELSQVYLYDVVHISHSKYGFETTAQVAATEWDAILRRYTKITIGDIFAYKAGTVAGYQIASNSLNGNRLIPGSVNGSVIADNTITANAIVANSITADQIAANTITAQQIAANAITANEISAGSITTEKLQAGAITTETLAANSITTEKLQAQSITAETLAAGAVTADKIKAGEITSDHIQAGSIDANSINTDDLAANTAFITKLTSEQGFIDTLTSNDAYILALQSNNIRTALLTAGDVQTDTAGIKTAFIDLAMADKVVVPKLSVTDDMTAVSISAGAIKVKGDDGVMRQLVVADDGSVTGVKLSDVVQINGGTNIIENSITADKLNVSQIFSNEAVIQTLTSSSMLAETIVASDAFLEVLSVHQVDTDALIMKVRNDLQWSSGANLLRNTSDEFKTVTGSGRIEIGSFATENDYKSGRKIAFRAYLKPVSGSWKVNIGFEQSQETSAIIGEAVIGTVELSYNPDPVYSDNSSEIEFGVSQPGWSTTYYTVPDNTIRVHAYLYCTSGSGSCEYHSAKVEYGEMATAWCMAYEDYDEDFKEIETKFEITAGNVQAFITDGTEKLSKYAQTIDGFTTRVQDIEGNISQLTQTATELSSSISSANGNISQIRQTASSLQSQITDSKNEYSTLINQTSNSISTQVSDAKEELYSNITQTAESINATITDTKTELETKITANASGITAGVSEAKEHANSLYSQTASSISTAVSNSASNIRSEFQQTVNDINAKVGKLDANGNFVGTGLTITSDKINISSAGQGDAFTVNNTMFKVSDTGYLGCRGAYMYSTDAHHLNFVQSKFSLRDMCAFRATVTLHSSDINTDTTQRYAEKWVDIPAQYCTNCSWSRAIGVANIVGFSGNSKFFDVRFITSSDTKVRLMFNTFYGASIKVQTGTYKVDIVLFRPLYAKDYDKNAGFTPTMNGINTSNPYYNYAEKDDILPDDSD